MCVLFLCSHFGLSYLLQFYNFTLICWSVIFFSFLLTFLETQFFLFVCCCSLLFSSSVVPNSLWPHRLQHARPPCPSPTPRACSYSCPLSQGCHPTILSSVIPSPSAFNLSQHQGLFQWVSSSRQLAKVLEFQL